MIYKVWVQIEEIDEAKDHYQNVSTPEELDKFDTLKDAENFVASLTDEITVTVSGGVAYCDDPRVEIIDDEHLQQYNALLEACKAVVDDTKLPIRGTLQAQLRAAISQAEKE